MHIEVCDDNIDELSRISFLLEGYLADYEGYLLADTSFYKPHRSYVVNLSQVTELDKNGLLTTAGKRVPIARDAFAKVKAVYMKYLLAPKERRDTLS